MSELSAIAVVRSLPKELGVGLGSAMVLAQRDEETQQFLVAELAHGAVAIAADLSALSVGELPELLEAGRYASHQARVEEVILDLAGLDPGSRLLQLGVGKQRAIRRWVRGGLVPADEALAGRRVGDGGRHTAEERLELARLAAAGGLVSNLKVFGEGSWSPYEDPQCEGWLRQGFRFVEFCLAGRRTSVQGWLLLKALPRGRRANGWIQEARTGAWIAGDREIARLVSQLHKLIAAEPPVSYEVTSTGFRLVGHLTIDVRRHVIAIHGTRLAIPLEPDTSARIVQALGEDEVLAAHARR